MPAKNKDLHGNVPDKSSVALILIDVINDLEWEGGEALFDHALPMAEKIVALKERAKALNIPVIYVNDNFGKWRSDFRALVERCVGEETRGKPIVEQLRPDDDDYFVLKPKHSGFFGTALDTLLEYLGAKTLILAGIAGNSCVQFTANDAYFRDFQLVIPADCTASNSRAANEAALKQMKAVLDADITPSDDLDLEAMLHAEPEET